MGGMKEMNRVEMSRRVFVHFIIFLFLLGACDSEAMEKATDDVLVPSRNSQELPSTFQGISIEIKQDNHTGNITEILVLFKNTTDYEAAYESAFSIEKKADGKWYTIPFEAGTGFGDINYLLPPNATELQTYQLSSLQKEMTPGEYRFVKNFSIGIFREKTLAAEFNVIE